jgi:hypothetical protein
VAARPPADLDQIRSGGRPQDVPENSAWDGTRADVGGLLATWAVTDRLQFRYRYRAGETPGLPLRERSSFIPPTCVENDVVVIESPC